MQVKFEFAIYDEEQNTFELDEKTYSFELNEEQAKSYELFQGADLHMYNWFNDSQTFQDWIKEEVYPDEIGKKIVITDIGETSFRRYFFFKVTSGDVHYEYFKELFGILHETDWQDREEVGHAILERLAVKRLELIIELKEDVEESEEETEEVKADDAKN